MSSENPKNGKGIALFYGVALKNRKGGGSGRGKYLPLEKISQLKKFKFVWMRVVNFRKGHSHSTFTQICQFSDPLPLFRFVNRKIFKLLKYGLFYPPPHEPPI